MRLCMLMYACNVRTFHCLYIAAFERFCPIVGQPVKPAVQEAGGLRTREVASSQPFTLW